MEVLILKILYTSFMIALIMSTSLYTVDYGEVLTNIIENVSIETSVDSGRFIYVAVVIHMNQLLEDIRKINIYGSIGYSVFYPESRLVHEIPGFKLTVDITGPTIHSLLASAPEVIDNFREGVREGVVEILSVTYGQIPIQFLPWTDVVKHVEYENRLIRELFNTTPRGIWQEDRQWTPDLIKLVKELGFEYTLIDDNVFWRGNPNLDSYEVYYPHIACDSEGNEIIVFHISEFMRYHFRDTASIDDIRNFLLDILNHTMDKPIPPIVVYGDDAEFGLNPDVIRELVKEPWIKFITLSEYIDLYHDMLTPANYNVTGAYREYEQRFGLDWYKWYTSSTADWLLGLFNETRSAIIELEDVLEENSYSCCRELLDYSWTCLLLAEWQYGPFYNTWINSNLYWTIDSYLIARITELWINGFHGYTVLSFSNEEYYAYISDQLGIVFDLNTVSLRIVVDYYREAVYSPLRVFESSEWRDYSEYGLLYLYGGSPRDIVSIDNGFKLVYNDYYIVISVDGLSIDIVSNKLLSLLLRISPGGFNKYLYMRPPDIGYEYVGDRLVVDDELGSTIVVDGVYSCGDIEHILWYVKIVVRSSKITLAFNLLEKPTTSYTNTLATSPIETSISSTMKTTITSVASTETFYTTTHTTTSYTSSISGTWTTGEGYTEHRNTTILKHTLPTLVEEKPWFNKMFITTLLALAIVLATILTLLTIKYRRT